MRAVESRNVSLLVTCAPGYSETKFEEARRQSSCITSSPESEGKEEEGGGEVGQGPKKRISKPGHWRTYSTCWCMR
jgi:hypothetical protein